MTPAESFRQVAGTFTDRVRGVSDWEASAPVEGWTARDVVRHLVDWFPPMLKAGAGIELPPGPSVDNDPVGAWTSLVEGVQEVLDDPATTGRTLHNPHLGEMPVAQAVEMVFTGDVFLHTWDLARASGQDETLDPQRCAAMLTGMEPMESLLRSSGQYGPRVPVADDADVQTRLIAFIGRDPR